MTDAEKLEIAVNLLDKHGLEEYEEQVYGHIRSIDNYEIRTY